MLASNNKVDNQCHSNHQATEFKDLVFSALHAHIYSMLGRGVPPAELGHILQIHTRLQIPGAVKNEVGIP